DAICIANPGGTSDTIDGGPGQDALTFNGSNISETIDVVPDGAGFDVLRDIASVRLVAQSIEELIVNTRAGTDDVATTVLPNTAQAFVDGSDTGEPDGLPDVLHVDVCGLCPRRQQGTLSWPAPPTVRC